MLVKKPITVTSILYSNLGRKMRRAASKRRERSSEIQFYVSKAKEINRRFRGRHIAIIGDRVVASGRSPIEVWQRAKKMSPRGKPVLAYVPKDDTLVLIVG